MVASEMAYIGMLSTRVVVFVKNIFVVVAADITFIMLKPEMGVQSFYVVESLAAELALGMVGHKVPHVIIVAFLLMDSQLVHGV